MHNDPAMPLGLASLVLAGLAGLYFRGWLVLRRTNPMEASARRLAAMATGLAVLWISSCSPLAMLDETLLTAHMVQHLLIMLAAAPLLLLAAPAAVFPLALPSSMRDAAAGVHFGPMGRKAGAVVTHPAFCWLAGTAAVMAWHVPAIFAAARSSMVWHWSEHASFLAAGLLFWWPVILPWPATPVWPRWSIPLYLFFATLPCDVLSAFLAFSGRVIYPQYLSAARPFALSALQDQECAGALMWTAVTFAYLAPAAVVTVRLLSPPAAPEARLPYARAVSGSGRGGDSAPKPENTRR